MHRNLRVQPGCLTGCEINRSERSPDRTRQNDTSAWRVAHRHTPARVPQQNTRPPRATGLPTNPKRRVRLSMFKLKERLGRFSGHRYHRSVRQYSVHTRPRTHGLGMQRTQSRGLIMIKPTSCEQKNWMRAAASGQNHLSAVAKRQHTLRKRLEGMQLFMRSEPGSARLK